MKKETRFFGHKESFAIAVGDTQKPNRYFLLLWINNLAFGTFTKAGELTFAKKTYEQIKKNKEQLIVPMFKAMTAKEIFDYNLKIDFDTYEGTKRFDELKPIYDLTFFGTQFTNKQSYALVYYEDGDLCFVWQNDFGKPINEGRVKFELFCSVFDEFVAAYPG